MDLPPEWGLFVTCAAGAWPGLAPGQPVTAAGRRYRVRTVLEGPAGEPVVWVCLALDPGRRTRGGGAA